MTVKPNLVLHVGLPKTGTTAIQHVLAAGFTELVAGGTWYPGRFPDLEEPFHRFLVEELRTPGDLPTLRQVICSAREVGVERVILSAEGISAHHDVFFSSQLREFIELTTEWQVSLWFIARSFDAWSRSMYVQCLLSPLLITDRPTSTLEKFYGTSATYEQFKLAVSRIGFDEQERLAASLGKRFAASDVHILDYDETDSGEIVGLLAGRDPHSCSQSANTSISFDRCETLRSINRNAESQSTRVILLALLALDEGVVPKIVVIQLNRMSFRKRLWGAARILLAAPSRTLLRSIRASSPSQSYLGTSARALFLVVVRGGLALGR